MAFDSDTRNKLARIVAQARQLLTDEFTHQLQEIYGIQPDSAMAAIEKLAHLDDEEAGTALLLRERIDHLASGMTTEKEPVVAAIDRTIREQAFTLLNRFAALRLCEERGFIEECVRKGFQSKGFQVYERVAGAALGDTYERYKTFLFCLFDEIAFDLRMLFDRFSPQGLLFPREQALLDLFAIININDLGNIWSEDETIGWIYQYFNPSEERRAMRAASKAPRNSRELAVRNQFFTPRYVVEFLTDNTLGRIWYEMRKGDTVLKEECRYLVRRPNEIFLAQGENAPPAEENEIDLSQEELLKQPAYVEHRPKKDPRDLKVLDPARGSGHFLLYAFDLLERIYEEAWEDTESPKSEATGHTLREDYELFDNLCLAVPKLIMEHNLYGIDIDPRAMQIAALALWLRAQKSWKSIGLKAVNRPQITKSNIVTAEPIPGEEVIRREFIEGLKPSVLGQLVEVVFDKMNLAGEAGTLLKIEAEIQDGIRKAKEQWILESRRAKDKKGNELLFSQAEIDRLAGKVSTQKKLFDMSYITDEEFWNQAEERILAALQVYAEQIDSGRATRRRFFADDASRGFAFIDLCYKRYDVVLMNPPFGDFSLAARSFGDFYYPRASRELYASFIERGKEFCTFNGLLGAITSRTGFFIKSLSSWREQVVMPFGIRLFVELGEGVLDSALVETATYVLGPKNNELINRFPSIFIRLPEMEDKSFELAEEIKQIKQNKASISKLLFQNTFNSIQDTPLAYWLPSEVLAAFKKLKKIEGSAATIKVGLQTGDDFRFVRTFWEIPPEEITGNDQAKIKWVPHAKGGENSPFWTDIHLLVKWHKNGKEVKAHHQSRPQNRDFYFKRGLTFPYRVFRFSPAALPKGCITGVAGMGIFPLAVPEGALLAVLNTDVVNKFVSIWLGRIEMGSLYQAGTIQAAPFPEINSDAITRFSYIGKTQTMMRIERNSYFETSRHFVAPEIVLSPDYNSVKRESESKARKFKSESMLLFQEAGVLIRSLYQLEKVPDDFFVEYHKKEATFEYTIELPPCNLKSLAFDILSYSIGCLFGRWDVRIALDSSLAPKLPEPFDSLPVCPPGMLVGPAALPAEPARIVSVEWLRARPNANTIPIEGSVKEQSIADADYPLSVSWDGVLVDDPGFNGGHPTRNDIVARLREVLDLIWKDEAHKIEQESCKIIGVTDLHDHFRRPSGFFQGHLKRYSKSRRKAPIYWPISTSSGSYTLWLYYHRLTDQTLYACINDYVNPKLDDIAKDVERLQEQVAKQTTAQNREKLEQLMDLERELKDFRDELLRVASLPFKPNLNDGAIITASPLRKLFRHNQWRKDLEACWKKLEAGEYDWAHLAYAIWPDRVEQKCKKDLSIAIAHGLEGLYEGEINKTKKRGEKKS